MEEVDFIGDDDAAMTEDGEMNASVVDDSVLARRRIAVVVYLIIAVKVLLLHYYPGCSYWFGSLSLSLYCYWLRALSQDV